MATFHIVTGEYPPSCAGVGDYTRLLAHSLVTRGHDVHVWCPNVTDRPQAEVRVHRLPDDFGARGMAALEQGLSGAPGVLLLQYVPNALGRRGANVRFCRWLLRARRGGTDVRVMFHEPYFYFSWSPSGNALALVQRVMAALLLRAACGVYVSTETWERYLRPWAARGTDFVPLPIPATVDTECSPNDESRWRRTFAGDRAGRTVVGHFGTFGDHVAGQLRRAVPAILDVNPSAMFACVGRNSTEFAAELSGVHPSLRGRVAATGHLDASHVAAALRACDLLVQPYPDGVTTRRTSVMAPLACGVATVTTDGALTENVWRETGAARLIPPSDPSAAAAAVSALLADRPARETLARHGREIYEARFTIDRTLDRLFPAVPARA